MLWQKWLICSVFCFWGYFEESEIDDAGNVIGVKKKYLRVVNDILMVIASGNSKTTFMGFLNTYLLYSKNYPAAKIYIGSNAQKQSLLCFDATREIIQKNRMLKKYARIVPSIHTIEIKEKNSKLLAMSSDGANWEGIIPTNIMLDEIHAMQTSAYAEDLRKSVKRDDSFIFETTTMGTVRGGYMDGRLSNVVLTFNHSVDNLLASTRNGSLKLFADDIGLRISANIVDTAVGRDAYKLIKNGLISRMSFRAVVKDNAWDYLKNLRNITSFGRFFDVSAVTIPAYEDTLIIARAGEIDAYQKQVYEYQINKLNQILGKK